MGRKARVTSAPATVVDEGEIDFGQYDHEPKTDMNDTELDAVLAMLNGDPVETELIVGEPEEPVETEDGDGGTTFIDVEATVVAAEPEEPVDAEIEDAELEPEDVAAALAQVEADDAAAATTKTATKRAPRQPKATTTGTKTTTPSTPLRVFTDVAAIDPAVLKANLDGCSAKKVGEKAENVIQAVEHGKKLSRYTSDAIKKLSRDGRVTSKALVDEFLSLNLSDGTARAQSQQMTALFKMLGIASPDPANAKELVIADAALVEELVKLAA